MCLHMRCSIYLILFLCLLAVIPTETGIIVLVDNTPEVMLESGAGTVRVQFTLTFDATSVSCFLRDIATSRQDCEF